MNIKQMNEMNNFDQAMLIRDVIEYLKSIRQDLKALEKIKKGLLEVLATAKAENATIGYAMIFDSLSTWGADIYRVIPEMLQLRARTWRA